MAKIESGETEIVTEDFKLCDFLRENILNNQVLAVEHGVELLFTADLSDNWIKTDESRLNQIINNLVSNAIKFSCDNGKVEVILKSVNDSYQIAVSDNGPGIDKAYQPFLFDKFTQEQSAHTRKVGGTGLGLDITKGLVDILGGKLSYETSPKGTKFLVNIPNGLSDQMNVIQQSNL